MLKPEIIPDSTITFEFFNEEKTFLYINIMFIRYFVRHKILNKSRTVLISRIKAHSKCNTYQTSNNFGLNHRLTTLCTWQSRLYRKRAWSWLRHSADSVEIRFVFCPQLSRSNNAQRTKLRLVIPVVEKSLLSSFS